MDVDRLIRKHRSTGVVVDANLVVLYVVGRHDIRLIGECGRTRQFTPEDFELLSLLLERLPRRLLTPNILTEVSNLARRVNPREREGVMNRLADVIDGADERFVPSAQVARKESCLRLGLTDSGVLEKLCRKRLLLTADLDLYIAAQRRGMDALNFNHLREWFWNRHHNS